MRIQLALLSTRISQWTGLPARIIRFIISGGLATVTELAFLYICTEFFGVWYLVSLVIGFMVACIVSFTLQKFWTFEDARTDTLYVQAPFYFLNAIANLAVNAALLYFLVEYIHLWYLLAQVFITVLIAVWNFLFYKFVIFKREQ